MYVHCGKEEQKRHGKWPFYYGDSREKKGCWMNECWMTTLTTCKVGIEKKSRVSSTASPDRPIPNSNHLLLLKYKIFSSSELWAQPPSTDLFIYSETLQKKASNLQYYYEMSVVHYLNCQCQFGTTSFLHSKWENVQFNFIKTSFERICYLTI